jgi:transposase-like protein
MNANQLFKWRRAFERGELNNSCAALIPVSVSNCEDESESWKLPRLLEARPISSFRAQQ